MLGLALITKNEARLWTDGRYFLQAMQQLSDEWTLMRMGEDPLVEVWMSDVSQLLKIDVSLIFGFFFLLKLFGFVYVGTNVEST